MVRWVLNGSVIEKLKLYIIPFYLSYDAKNKTNTRDPCACIDDEETIFSCFHRVYPPGENS
jgi:hypothetical protein